MMGHSATLRVSSVQDLNDTKEFKIWSRNFSGELEPEWQCYRTFKYQLRL